MPRRTDTHFWRYSIIVLIGIVGTSASIGMFAAIRQWQAHVANVRFTSLARDDLQTINSGLRDATDLLYTMRAYFESLDHRVSRAEFQAFSHSLRERVVGLRDTGWAPRVTAAERDAFEHEVRASGFPNFQIIERNADGAFVRAKQRAEYFPILYSDPGKINLPVLGFDLTSESVRRHAVAQARDTDQAAATPPLKLMNVRQPNGGVMSFISLPDGQDATGDASRPVAGVLLGAFETSAMIENILTSNALLNTVDLYLFDPNGPAGKRLIYWHSADGKPAPSEAALLAGRHWQGTLQLVDQKWGAIFVPSDVFDAGIMDWIAPAVLFGGLIVAASIIGYLWFSMRHTKALEKLTRSLRMTTDDLRRNSAKLDYLARRDNLTGLANRRVFVEALEQSIARSRRNGSSLAVLYLDLDHFKDVNDTLGHPVGDALLQTVAERLRESVRETDTVARFGGDEFAILLSDVSKPINATLVSEGILDAVSGRTSVEEEMAGIARGVAEKIIRVMNEPVAIQTNRINTGASVGIALYGSNAANAETLLSQADVALYRAKVEERGTYRFFTAGMDAEIRARVSLEAELRDAISMGQFFLMYQPQVDIDTGRIVGLEALVRWQHPTRGVVGPGHFILEAERNGLIVPLGRWILDEVCRQIRQWLDAGIASSRVAVNLSGIQFKRPLDLERDIDHSVADAGVPPHCLELELTESVLMEASSGHNDMLLRFRNRGYRLAIDDFGSGYSSLDYLRRYPVDRIKIDQKFIADIGIEPGNDAIVRAALGLARELNIEVVVEGVETIAQLELLKTWGCRIVQGYYFARPLSVADVTALLRVGKITLAPAGPRELAVNLTDA